MAVDSRVVVSLGFQPVEVEIISPATMDIAATADRDWGDLLKAAKTEDSSWVWADIIGDECLGVRFTSFAMISPRGVEGIMVLERGRMMQTPFAEGVTMHYLATAPWNRLKSDRTPLIPERERAKPIGSVLLTRALMFSHDEGYEGRLGWETLEGAREWYRDQFAGLSRFRELPRDLSPENLVSFETDSQSARAYLDANKTILSRCD
jgi:hypothetical protein